VRKFTSVILGAAIVVVALAGTGSAAGAADSASCSFSVAAGSAGHVDITGAAPAGVYVKAFVAGNVNPAGTGTANGEGSFAILGVAGSTSDTITVSYSANPETAYPTTSCSRVQGDVVVRVAADPSAAAALAFTGSSSSTSLVFVALAAIVVGLALVIGLRRRGAHAE